MSNHYTTLGLSDTASVEDIKSAYRKLAKQYHPDVNREEGSKEKMQEISEAYSILSDEAKRREYDDRLKYGASDQNVNDIWKDFDFVFNKGFSFSRGNRNRWAPNMHNFDITKSYMVDFIDVFKGTIVNCKYTREAECDACITKGNPECPKCKGNFKYTGTVNLALYICLREKLGDGMYINAINGNFCITYLNNIGGNSMRTQFGSMVMGKFTANIFIKMPENIKLGNDLNIYHNMDIKLADVLDEKMLLETIDGRKFKTKVKYSKYLNDITVKVPELGLMIPQGRTSYVFVLKILMPDISMLSEEDRNSILDRLRQ
jgi:DnaJ-class molecular chaperone